MFMICCINLLWHLITSKIGPVQEFMEESYKDIAIFRNNNM